MILNGDVSIDNGSGADTLGDAPNTWTLVADVPGGEGTLNLNANGTFSLQELNAWTGEPITRTKSSHPYSYEAFTVFGSRQDCDSGMYSDRMIGWAYEKYNRCCEEVWGNQGQYFNRSERTPKTIERFLQLYNDNDNLELTWIVEECNVSNGYPVWYFGFKENK